VAGRQDPGSAERLRLLDGTPVGCGQSTITAKRSDLFGSAGYGYEAAHSRYYRGSSSCWCGPPRGRSPGSASDEHDPGIFPNWLRQRVEAIIWTLKHQLGLEDHGGRVPAGLWARVVQRLLALNTAIWHNWQIGAPTKRSLLAYDH